MFTGPGWGLFTGPGGGLFTGPSTNPYRSKTPLKDWFLEALRARGMFDVIELMLAAGY
jgi:hypothetical protein